MNKIDKNFIDGIELDSSYMEQVAEEVFKVLGLEDWTLLLADYDGCECHNDIKMIRMNIVSGPWYQLESFLHEVAHIHDEPHYPSADPRCHNPAFHERLGKLLVQFAYLAWKRSDEEEAEYQGMLTKAKALQGE